MGKIQDFCDDIASGKKSPIKRMSSTEVIALGFLLTIIIGTILLMLPISSKGMPPNIIDALFTAVSATCVTGLVVFDTYTQWSLFGQIVLICLIQIGGIGFMTVISMISMAMGRKIGLKERSIMQESVNNTELGGIVRLMKKIAAGTVITELCGAVILAFRFVPKMGAAEGIYNAVFLSISAFCNAGFDLNGKYGEYSSLVEFYNEPAVVITVSMLILIGGIGFIVWDDISKNKLRFSAYKLHSKIALFMTIMLTISGTVLFFIFEQDFTIKDMSFGNQLLTSFFNSVTPRTAGFNTVDTAALSPASTVLTIIYMFIGGSPGSTAGGAKTVTVAVVLVTAVASMKNSEHVNIFGRRLEDDVPRKALTIIIINLTLAVAAITGILALQPGFDASDVVFEVFSALNTVGMTTGITRELNEISRIIILILMYCGRVGSVSFALIFTRTKQYSGVQNPMEKISIG